MVVFIAALVLACSRNSATSNMQEDNAIENHWIKIGETSVIYALSVPDTYDETEEPLPLVMALHYGGTPTTTYGKDFLEILILPGLGQLNAILAVPVIVKAGSWLYEENVRMVQALTDSLIQKYNVDTSRIVVTGYSLGAIGAWHLAALYPQRFSAAIPISGIPETNSLNMFKQSDVPLYAIHSSEDELFPLADLKKILEELKSLGKNITLKEVSGLSHYATGDFAEALRTAVPWLKERWSRP